MHATIEELLDMYLFIPLLLLGNSLVKMFLRQQRIVGGVIFYATRVV
jgi:hypothetical protein